MNSKSSSSSCKLKSRSLFGNISNRRAYLKGTSCISDINYRVVYKLVDIKIAPNILSTPSAIFLPVQLSYSVTIAYLVNGGLQVFGSGSLLLINLLSSRFLPILYKNILVMKASLRRATLLSPARSSA